MVLKGKVTTNQLSCTAVFIISMTYNSQVNINLPWSTYLHLSNSLNTH